MRVLSDGEHWFSGHDASLIIIAGVNSIQRAIAVRLTTHAEIKKVNDDEYDLKTVTGPVKKTRHMKFGVEFEDEAPAGGAMKVITST